MKKLFTILVLSAVLLLPTIALAADCPATENACQIEVTAGPDNECDCGTEIADEGEWCWAAGNEVYNTQADCQAAMAAAGAGPAAGPGGAAPTEGVPAGLSPCTMKHEVRGCGDECSVAGSAGDNCLLEACCLLDRIYTIADWIFVILLVVAGVFIIWGGFEFVTSGGNPEKVTSARNKLIWALVGVIVAFLARGLVRIVAQIVAK